MKCLDTDLLIAILRGKEEAKAPVADLDSESRGATTSISAFEIFFGAYKSARRKENVKEAMKLLKRLEVFSLDLSSSRRAAEISAGLIARGEAIDFRDAMIAGIVIENNLTLVTRNKTHFCRVKNLQLETW
jgi:predicted nucleic acid-binding protein